MSDVVPYYALLVVVLVFIFLWFFFGGEEEYEFVGLKPLINEEISYYEDEPVCKNSVELPTDKPFDEEIPIVYNKDVEIDLTPELPAAFTDKVCLNIDDNKFMSKGEKICKATVERIYGVEFKNTHPNWLKHQELECYNEKLGLAVEYMSLSHYKWSAVAKQTYSEFREQVRKDKLKKELCEKHGVMLIIVPYNVSHALIPTYIVYHLPEIVRKRIKDENIEL